MKNNMSIKDFSNLICHLNDKLLVELMEELNHIDDLTVVTYMRAYFIARVHQNCLKLKKGYFFYRNLYKNYKISFMEDIRKSFGVEDSKFLKAVLEYFDSGYKLIEKIFTSYEYHNFLEFENICNLILKEILHMINLKNKTDISIDMTKYELVIADGFALIENILVNL